ncbi:hypothetical protein VTK73DRAFT_2329 [Phialemonium thermophilum]|uniref:Uncharacterized protein n=1 Tax=Phialemonium thermophilum TaxID=223376 RepID=A0ABR3VS92_9PEZI
MVKRGCPRAWLHPSRFMKQGRPPVLFIPPFYSTHFIPTTDEHNPPPSHRRAKHTLRQWLRQMIDFSRLRWPRAGTTLFEWQMATVSSKARRSATHQSAASNPPLSSRCNVAIRAVVGVGCSASRVSAMLCITRLVVHTCAELKDAQPGRGREQGANHRDENSLLLADLASSFC